MEKGLEYSTSRGSILAERGPRNMVPLNNYLAGTGKSIVWMGAAYYVPSENRWIQQHEYRTLPREARRDAIYFESEDDWVAWKDRRDRPSHPSGISMSGYPTAYTGVPVPTLLPSKVNAINRRWSGAGYFTPSSNRWFHDTDSPGLPRESLQFYNEEDWLKFKYMVANPNMRK
ncbi:uncharacterized protein LOC127856636 [Dreissena polymorpha]|uniref:Uncharacterized protein n=1 Tax=Dreissena polymorpha TaxID=45954 RepID=A0A9D4C729_DREPO|nr:uncharacterized protein LOC127854960 [Dreissena polymorpha]XP_052248916.1 uncharacterized protein LOC127856636 [Dreissena polymorpha]KAH3718276.1 hypothetical protein DPMN_061078 [Dreissena polymorpha]KAH3718448.1 hypothetical protein DPMN_061252 [Dreissena polymorpha]